MPPPACTARAWAPPSPITPGTPSAQRWSGVSSSTAAPARWRRRARPPRGLLRFGLDPDDPDTDGNGVKDGDEDPDGDGVSTRIEALLGTDPERADSDGDGIPDGLEDSDGDGGTDALEALRGSDPFDPTSLPVSFTAQEIIISNTGNTGFAVEQIIIENTPPPGGD